jgi:hypothetical protein
MPKRTSKTGGELFIVDNSDDDWKVVRYLHDWCDLSKAIDIATGYFEIGSLLALDGQWQKVDKIRILIGDEVSKRTKAGFAAGLAQVEARLDQSLENERKRTTSLSVRPASSTPSARAKSSAASTAKTSSTPRRTSRMPGRRSSAHSRRLARRT